MKTQNLIGQSLEWAVSSCEGIDVYIPAYAETPWVAVRGQTGVYPVAFTTDWAQGGPVIEREQIETYYQHSLEMWAGRCDENVRYGPTPLIAAMRCFVASRLGDEIEIPEELK